MVEIRRGVGAEEVRQAARHTLFVEGSSDEAIDPQVLNKLLGDVTIQIKTLGPSSHIRSVAEALHKHHPYYYFLIDRDHHDDNEVERCWERFPDASTCNLLIWRRRELENYFLIPEYLSKSPYIRCSQDELKSCILETANKRIYFDAANIVIVMLREAFKKNWIENFNDVQAFATKEMALEQLLTQESFKHKKHETHERLHEDIIKKLFEEKVDTLFGGQSSLDFAQGKWLTMISGKGMLPTIINRCFRVRGERRAIQGNERLMEVVKSLLKLPLSEQPDDFVELHKLIAKQID